MRLRVDERGCSSRHTDPKRLRSMHSRIVFWLEKKMTPLVTRRSLEAEERTAAWPPGEAAERTGKPGASCRLPPSCLLPPSCRLLLLSCRGERGAPGPPVTATRWPMAGIDV